MTLLENVHVADPSCGPQKVAKSRKKYFSFSFPEKLKIL
jgi:hypothetical protein